MSFLFRHVRANLIVNNKVFKYLLYAIGEIFVVVIGILIAIQLNNSNEEYKRSKEVKALLATVENNIKSDIPMLDQVLMSSHRNDSLIQLVLQSKVTKETYSTNPEFLYLLTSAPNTVLNQVAVEAALRHLNDFTESHGDLIARLNNLLTTGNDLKQLQDRAMNYMLQVNHEWSNQYTWYKDLDKGTEEQIDYFYSNPIYKNKLFYFSILLKGNIHPTVEYYRQSAMNLLLEIWYSEKKPYQDILKELHRLIPNLDTLQLNEKTEIPNIKSRIKKERHCDLIISNQSSQPVILYSFYQDSDETFVETLSPGKIVLINDSNQYSYSIKASNGNVLGYLQGVDNSICTIQ